MNYAPPRPLRCAPFILLVLALSGAAVPPVGAAQGGGLLSALTHPTPAAQPDTTRRAMAPEDYHAFRFSGDPRISPDGSRILFQVTSISDDRRNRDSSLWIAAADGSKAPRPFTSGDRDRSPRWSPDGSRVAFLSQRDERTQLHIIHTDGGESYPVTELERGSISTFVWAPDGRSLLLALDLEPEVEDPTERAPDEGHGPEPDVVVIRDAIYKSDGAGYLDEQRQSLWVLELRDRGPGERGSLRRLTEGSSDWNDRGPDISPDGRWVAFHSDRTGEEYDGGFNQDLWLVPYEGGEPRLLETPPGRAEAPLWSPDGRWIAYRHSGGRFEPTELHRIPATGGSPEVLTADVDLDFGGVSWSPSGDALHFTSDFRGSRPLFRLPVYRDADDASTSAPLPDELEWGEGWGEPGSATITQGTHGSVAGFSYSSDGGSVAFILEDERNLPEVWVAAEGGEPRRLTKLNDTLLNALELGSLEEFRFRTEEGSEVQGFLLRPVRWDESRTYPMILNIKGGPSGMWGRQWFHEFQMMAGAGYAVAFVNYRGSTGYGHAHQAAVRLDYGGADARDNLTAVDSLLARHTWIDEERLFVTGGSHGGFLAGWLTARTDRFRAAVTQRMVSNWISEAGTQQYPPRRMMEEFGGTIWENFDHYWERSPLAHADQVRTPTLVIHSDRDAITPIGQGEEWYYALKALEIPTEMVVFQGEGHGLSRTGTPVNLVERLARILEWFERWDVGGTATEGSR